MNLDRALAILGVIVGLLGVAIGIYIAQKDPSTGLLLASGWAAAALIGTIICVLAFRAITAMEKAHSEGTIVLENAHKAAIRALETARNDAEERVRVLSNDVKALQAEVADYKNISRALSAHMYKEERPRATRARAKRQPQALGHENQDAKVEPANLIQGE